MRKVAELHEGKAKIIYSTPDEDQLIVYYKDDTTAGDGAKRAQIQGKGPLNLKISTYFFELLAENGVKTHYLETLNDREMLVRKVEIIPLEVVVRNIAAGSIAKRLGFPEGEKLPRTVVEFYYKDDSLGDPLVNRHHVLVLGAASCEEMDKLEEQALLVNSIRAAPSRERPHSVDFKLSLAERRMGRFSDEIRQTPAVFGTGRAGKKLDKDRFAGHGRRS